VYSPRPSPDGSNDHNHASIKNVIKLRGWGAWEEQGTESAEEMYSAEEVTGGGSERRPSTKTFTSFGWKAMAAEEGWGQHILPFPS